MTLLLQQILDGLTDGVLYAAIALSLVLVYRTSKVVNFAQGELATFGAYLTWQFYTWGVPLAVALTASIAVSFAAGALIERTLIRPLLKSSNHMPLFIICLGLLVVLINVEAWIWGYQVQDMPSVIGGPPIAVGPARMSRQDVVIIAACVLVAAILWYLFQRTRFGLAMRAASDNAPSASLLGLPVNATLTFSWGAAAGTGTMMASLVAPNQSLQPGMLLPVLLYSVAAATLGGLDSPLGAIVGGLIIGVAENLAGTYVPGIGQDLKQAVAFAIIMVVLLLRPQGLFGSRTVVRV